MPTLVSQNGMELNKERRPITQKVTDLPSINLMALIIQDKVPLTIERALINWNFKFK